MAKERNIFEGGKDYVLGIIKQLSEDDSMSILVTDNKQFPSLSNMKKGDDIIMRGIIKKVDKPAGADYPYFIVKIETIK